MELNTSRETASCAATEELPTFYETRMFITLLTRALHNGIPSYLSEIYFSIIHLRLGLPSRLFPPRFLTNILYEFRFFYV
jgi:hypothetical protein